MSRFSENEKVKIVAERVRVSTSSQMTNTLRAFIQTNAGGAGHNAPTYCTYLKSVENTLPVYSSFTLFRTSVPLFGNCLFFFASVEVVELY